MLVEVVVLVLVFLVFSRLHAAMGKDAAAATANALALQSVERAVHIDIELGLNRWLAGNPLLCHVAVYAYRLYYVAIVGVLMWVFIRHGEVFRKVRRTLVAMLLLVLPVYWLVPMSPPRFALPGSVDIVAMYDIFGRAPSAAGGGENVYSAMPSMHVGWSLWCAFAVWIALRAAHPRLALLSWIFPMLMIAIVFATGNHYVLDVVGGIVLVAASIGVAVLWGRVVERSTAGKPGEGDRVGSPSP